MRDKKYEKWTDLLEKLYRGVTDDYINNIIASQTIDLNKQMLKHTNIEGDTMAHILAKTNRTQILETVIKIYPNIVYKQNNNRLSLLYYYKNNFDFIKKICSEYEIEDHQINVNYSLIEYFILLKNFDKVDFFIRNLKYDSTHIISLLIISNFVTKMQILLIQTIITTNKVDLTKLDKQFTTPILLALITHIPDSAYSDAKLMIEFLSDNNFMIDYYGPTNNIHPIKYLLLTIKTINKADPILIDLIMLFINSKINMNIYDKYLNFPGHYAFSDGIATLLPINIKTIIINKTKLINFENKDQNTILNLLVSNDNWMQYRDILIQRKLKIFEKNKYKMSPYDNIKPEQRDDFLSIVAESYKNELKKKNNWIDPFDINLRDKIINGEHIDNQELVKRIIQTKISHPTKNEQKINIIKTKNVVISHFNPLTHNYLFYLHYLINKYNKIKIPISDAADKKYLNKVRNINDSCYSISSICSHLLLWKNKLIFDENLSKNIARIKNKYPNTHYILLKLTISSGDSNHANMLIYDAINNTIQRFDPYGRTQYFDNTNIDIALTNLFEKTMGFKYESVSNLVSNTLYQTISNEHNMIDRINYDPDGFCVAWCIWYCEILEINKEIKITDLVEKTITMINKKYNFQEYIRNYSYELEKHRINMLKQMGIKDKYWYSNIVPNNIQNKIIEKLEKSYLSLL
jgi:hypothetical protein